MSTSSCAETGAVQGKTCVQYPSTIYDQPLCQQCLQLDFDAIFGLDGLSYMDHHFIEHFSHWSSGVTACSLCLLMRFTVSRERADDPRTWLWPTVHYRLLQADAPHGLPRYTPFSLINIAHRSRLAFASPGRPMPTPPFIVSSRAHGLDFVRQIQAGSIEYGIISEWLACCHKHRRCDPLESLSLVAVGNLRLIDCNNRSIVPGPGRKYVTLSYVWGPRARNDTVGDFIESLPPRSPDTIEDAIQVTKKLGFRYIWIDRYCIDRRDALKFKFQLHQMGDIYRNSSLTEGFMGF